MIRAILLSLVLAPPALAQPLPTAKPPPLAQQAPAAPPGPAAAPGDRCPAQLANACLSQQGACQVACPPLWSPNPGAPAFTPTDRAGCMQQCFQRWLACRRLHGC
ncbi:hypothetical protein [Roseomonas rosulenta]|uniref:hypothetical protein n=1 Tax=Roseomonas rosulenta TaxID=2748667 RepID=UPI0018DF2873|nr:hypothetical protein [Roseomonas rosulenta]